MIESLLKQGIRTEAARIGAHGVANRIVNYLFWTVAQHTTTVLQISVVFLQLSGEPDGHGGREELAPSSQLAGFYFDRN